MDTYGVGTRLVSGSGAPTAGFVYKLVAITDGTGWMRPVAKRSAAKVSIGGRKTPYRLLDERGAVGECFTLGDTSPAAPGPCNAPPCWTAWSPSLPRWAACRTAGAGAGRSSRTERRRSRPVPPALVAPCRPLGAPVAGSEVRSRPGRAGGAGAGPAVIRGGRPGHLRRRLPGGRPPGARGPATVGPLRRCPGGAAHPRAGGRRAHLRQDLAPRRSSRRAHREPDAIPDFDHLLLPAAMAWPGPLKRPAPRLRPSPNCWRW